MPASDWLQTGPPDGPAADYAPRPAPFFRPRWIVKTKGCEDTPERRRLVEGIVRAYPRAEVIDRTDCPHNKVPLPQPVPLSSGPVDRLARGKKTLVLAVHGTPVGESCERGNACPQYVHFSPYGFCPFDCLYCYLAGTPGVWFSPTVKVYVNLTEILQAVDRRARRIGRPAAFYLGKLQDGLALDPLTGYSLRLAPFFARHPTARMVVLTKSTAVENLLRPGLEHGGRTVLTWSLNPPEISGRFERNVPRPAERIEAMTRCAEAGYPVRALLMPVIPVDGWKEIYGRFAEDLAARAPLERLTLGGICSFPTALWLSGKRLGEDNPIGAQVERGRACADGRTRFPQPLRVEFYRHVIDRVRRARPGLPIGLCLEEHSTFERLGMEDAVGRCNCVL